MPWYLGSGTSVRKWDFSYVTSSCITYFKLREHLTLIKSGSKNKFGRCDPDDLAMPAILLFCFFVDRKTFKKYKFYSS